MALTPEERKEVEELKNDPLVKLANATIRKSQDPERKRLYQLRWLRKKGEQISKELDRTVRSLGKAVKSK